MSDDTIKKALKMMPYGFYVLTSHAGDEVNIMVSNWLTQISFEPRLVAWGLQRTSHTHELVEKGKVFTINILRKEDDDLIMQFTKSRAKDPDKVKNASYSPAPETGCPVLDGAVAYIECKVLDIVGFNGDHDIVVGEVVGAGVREELEPGDVLTLPAIGWSYAG